MWNTVQNDARTGLNMSSEMPIQTRDQAQTSARMPIKIRASCGRTKGQMLLDCRPRFIVTMNFWNLRQKMARIVPRTWVQKLAMVNNSEYQTEPYPLLTYLTPKM